MRRYAFLLVVPLLIAMLTLTLGVHVAWAVESPPMAWVGPAYGLDAGGTNRMYMAVLGGALAAATLVAAGLVWAKTRGHSGLSQRIVQEKSEEIRRLAESKNYEIHVNELAEALGIDNALAKEVMQTMRAQLLSDRIGGGLYRLPHILKESREDVGRGTKVAEKGAAPPTREPPKARHETGPEAERRARPQDTGAVEKEPKAGPPGNNKR